MGVIVTKKTDKSSGLGDRIDEDLKKRVQNSTLEDPDMVEGSDYAKDLKTTGKFGWIWAVLIILALISLVIIVVL